MATWNLLYKNSVAINSNIRVVIPTVEQILAEEEAYYSLVTVLTAAPIDLMVPLDDAGIDFTTIDDYELFLILFASMKTQDTGLLFGDLDLSGFEAAINEQNGSVVLLDRANDILIDRATHGRIADVLRKIHHLEKNKKKPGNTQAKEYMLERARKKRKRNAGRPEVSQLERLIVAMVNAEPYKYDFEGTKRLTIYQFNESVRQVVKKVDYNNRMYGVYTGSISVKDLSQDDLNWLSHK